VTFGSDEGLTNVEETKIQGDEAGQSLTRQIGGLYGGPIDEKFKCGKLSVFLHFTAIFTVFKYLANDSRPLMLCGICPILGGIN